MIFLLNFLNSKIRKKKKSLESIVWSLVLIFSMVRGGDGEDANNEPVTTRARP